MNAAQPKDIEAEVIALVEGIAPTRKPITKDSALWHDLHIHGDDANELLEDIAKRFNVTFRDMWFPDYFPNETDGGLLGCLFERLGIPAAKHRRLTVNHLFAVIERGHWFDPENSS